MKKEQIKTNFLLDKCLTALGFTFAACTLVGIILFPSELKLVNIMVGCLAGIMMGKEIMDAVKIHSTEKFSRKLLKKLEELEAQEKEEL